MGRDGYHLEWQRSGIRLVASLCLVLVAAFVAAGCGDSADDAGANGVPTLGFMISRDQTGLTEQLFRQCERESGGKYKLKSIPMGPSVDAQREQLTRRLAAGDDAIDLILLDVIWTAEFADAGWIVDMTKRVEPIKDQYVPAALASTRYKDRYWAVPVGTNAALLYYRTDLVDGAPKTWEELAADVQKAKKQEPDIDGFVFQGNSYEGGSVNGLEYMLGAGSKILSDDGKKVLIDDNDGAEHALEFLSNMVDDKVASKVVTTYVEEDARLAFQNGNAVFMRNWPYAWALMNQDETSKVKGKFDVAPLPGFEGRGSASVLGGQNYGIAASSDQPDLAWEAIMCLSSEKMQRIKAVKKGEMPTLSHLYDDPQLTKDIPFLPVLKQGLAVGYNRPTTPYYNEVTIVIYKAFNDVLNGRLDPKDAVKRMQRGVQAAIDGKAEI